MLFKQRKAIKAAKEQALKGWFQKKSIRGRGEKKGGLCPCQKIKTLNRGAERQKKGSLKITESLEEGTRRAEVDKNTENPSRIFN